MRFPPIRRNRYSKNQDVQVKRFKLKDMFIFWAMSAFLIGVGFLVHSSNWIDPSWSATEGVVVGVERSGRKSNGSGGRSNSYYAIVNYEVDEKNLVITATDGSSKYPKKGESREVAYNPDNPLEAKVVASESSKIFGIVLPIAGIAMFIGSIVVFVRSIKRSKSTDDIRLTGTKIQGVLTDIRKESSTSQYNTLIVTATDPYGEVRNYVSDKLESTAGLAIADYASQAILIDVYIDPTNPDRYYVDVDDMPKLTPEKIIELKKSVIEQALPSIRPDNEKPSKL